MTIVPSGFSFLTIVGNTFSIQPKNYPEVGVWTLTIDLTDSLLLVNTFVTTIEVKNRPPEYIVPHSYAPV